MTGVVRDRLADQAQQTSDALAAAAYNGELRPDECEANDFPPTIDGEDHGS